MLAEPTKVARGNLRSNRIYSEYLGLQYWLLQIKFSCATSVGSGRYQTKVLKLAKKKIIATTYCHAPFTINFTSNWALPQEVTVRKHLKNQS